MSEKFKELLDLIKVAENHDELSEVEQKKTIYYNTRALYLQLEKHLRESLLRIVQERKQPTTKITEEIKNQLISSVAEGFKKTYLPGIFVELDKMQKNKHLSGIYKLYHDQKEEINQELIAYVKIFLANAFEKIHLQETVQQKGSFENKCNLIAGTLNGSKSPLSYHNSKVSQQPSVPSALKQAPENGRIKLPCADQITKSHGNPYGKAEVNNSSTSAKKTSRQTTIFAVPAYKTCNEISDEGWQDIIQQVIAALKNSSDVTGSVLKFASKIFSEPVGFNAVCVELLNDKERSLQAKIAILFVMYNLIETNPGREQLRNILREKVNSPVNAILVALEKNRTKKSDWDSLNDAVDKINGGLVTTRSAFKLIDELFPPEEASKLVFKCQSPQLS